MRVPRALALICVGTVLSSVARARADAETPVPAKSPQAKPVAAPPQAPMLPRPPRSFHVTTPGIAMTGLSFAVTTGKLEMTGAPELLQIPEPPGRTR